MRRKQFKIFCDQRSPLSRIYRWVSQGSLGLTTRDLISYHPLDYLVIDPHFIPAFALLSIFGQPFFKTHIFGESYFPN